MSTRPDADNPASASAPTKAATGRRRASGEPRHGAARRERPKVLVFEPRALVRHAIVSRLGELSREFAFVASADHPLKPEHLEAFGGAQLAILSIGPARAIDAEFRNAIRTLRQALPGVPIAILADRSEPEMVQESFRQGVRGYLTTYLNAQVVVAAVRLLSAGGTFVPADTFLSALREESAAGTPLAADISEEAILSGRLTPRQRQILERFADGQPTAAIARDLGRSESTIKVHLFNIMRRLGVDSRTQLVAVVRRLRP